MAAIMKTLLTVEFTRMAVTRTRQPGQVVYGSVRRGWQQHLPQRSGR